MRRNASLVWAAMSPAGPAPVVPATATCGPTRTAREYPTTDSKSDPDETTVRLADMRSQYGP